ncbi:MAG: DNA alkylation repair protein [Clostridia bacterium]|nr:DNA alkylation repair protein [Clostridia bacterium]
MDLTPLQQRLFDLQDPGYRAFHCSLMPTIDPDCVIGVRVPALRAFAKTLSPKEAAAFLRQLPHRFYEENNLHAFLICAVKSPGDAFDAVERFLPYVDNWATCDGLSPRAFKKDLPRLKAMIPQWLDSEHVYTVRFGAKMVMDHFLAPFDPALLDAALSVRSEEYYINMMLAWLLATALAKQYDAAVRYLEANTLPDFVHAKAIQKAVESYRITPEQKAYLRTLRRKKERGTGK